MRLEEVEITSHAYSVPKDLPGEMIVDRYAEVSRALGEMFVAMGERSKVEAWRFNGVGSCISHDGKIADVNLVGPVKKAIKDARLKLQEIIPGAPSKDCCPHHRPNYGCILGPLKGPYCLAFIDYPEELNKRFKIDGHKLTADIFNILNVTQLQNTDASEDPILSQTTPEEFHQLSLDAIREMTSYVETFPILKAEERSI